MSKACSRRKGRGRGVVLGLGLAAGLAMTAPAASGDPVFETRATAACVASAAAAAPSLSGHAVLDCVGQSAQACMMTPGGDTTVGMIDCLGQELAYWSARLDTAHAEARATAKALDAELRDIGSAAASLTDSLSAMQAAWVDFRDAACRHAQAQWMGGTGGGPATMACHMHETARQALRLEGWWAE